MAGEPVQLCRWQAGASVTVSAVPCSPRTGEWYLWWQQDRGQSMWPLSARLLGRALNVEAPSFLRDLGRTCHQAPHCHLLSAWHRPESCWGLRSHGGFQGQEQWDTPVPSVQ